MLHGCGQLEGLQGCDGECLVVASYALTTWRIRQYNGSGSARDYMLNATRLDNLIPRSISQVCGFACSVSLLEMFMATRPANNRLNRAFRTNITSSFVHEVDLLLYAIMRSHIRFVQTRP